MSKIALVGMMGCGKSTLGRVLAVNANHQFYDLDQLIEIKEKSCIEDIFEKNGERYFRDCEARALDDFLNSNPSNCILALGGGTFTSYHQKILKDKGFISLYLECSIGDLVSRLTSDIKKRPLLKNLSPAEIKIKVETLSKLRESDYQQADLVVDARAGLDEILSLLCL